MLLYISRPIGRCPYAPVSSLSLYRLYIDIRCGGGGGGGKGGGGGGGGGGGKGAATPRKVGGKDWGNKVEGKKYVS
jgi:hypothetical protein